MNADRKNTVPRAWASMRQAVIGLAAVVAVGFPAQTPAQEAGARRLEDAMPPEYAARVREIAREAREAGVPPGLIARKAFEGTAKGHPPERVISALDAYAGRLREARDILGPDRRPASLAAAAEVEDDLLVVLVKLVDFFRGGNERDEEDVQHSFFQSRLDRLPIDVRADAQLRIQRLQPTTGFVALIESERFVQ